MSTCSVRSCGCSAPTSAAQTTEKWGLLALAGVAAALAVVASWWLGSGHALVIGLSLAAVGTGGFDTYRKGLVALRHANLSMNALMSVAVTGAMLIGEWPEAAMVSFLFALAERIEGRSLVRARHAIRGLLTLAPEQATVRGEDGRWQELTAKQVAVGALVRVGPGERIALDGVVTEGNSAVNQAPITGESLPVDKQAGDTVYAGTVNGTGSFQFRVTAPATDSVLAHIIHAVEAAQASRAPTQRFVDRFARVYTPAVFAIALLVAALPPLALGLPAAEWVYRALVLLVIACPCALVISVPVTIVSGLAVAARHGILIKGGVFLEQGRKLKALALDKTGTLTQGRPQVTDFQPRPGVAAEEALSLARSLAARSDHPASRAVAAFAAAQGAALLELTAFAALPGQGVKGRLDDAWLHLGNHRLMEQLGRCDAELELELAALEQQGKATVLLADEARVLAVFAIADTLRPTSRQALAELRALGLHTVILTGDNRHTAESIARQVGIDDARSHLLPEEKLEVVAQLRATFGPVGMAGDGINDAPALARADIGFAMGAAGSATALETADVALMDDDLRKLPHFIRLSRRTVAVLGQNIGFALGIKLAFLLLAVAGEATLWMAVFADMGTSLLVVFNGLRLLRTPGLRGGPQ